MNLSFETADQREVSLNVRAIDGPRPAGVAPVYEILDESGKPTVLSFDITVDKSRAIGMYDCVQIENGDVFAYRWLTKERSVKLGKLVQG